MDRIAQVYRHYTVNDQNTLGMNGFLRFLKDLDLMKRRSRDAEDKFRLMSYEER